MKTVIPARKDGLWLAPHLSGENEILSRTVMEMSENCPVCGSPVTKLQAFFV